MPPSPAPKPPGNLDQVDVPPSAFFGTPRTLPEPLPSEPFSLFQTWLDEAWKLNIQPNPNAMSLATIDPDGTPANRIVLCKSVDPASGHVCFYTNYQGRKGRALARNNRAAACFHWDRLDRQVRIEGLVAESPAGESDAYFASRPWMSRIGAWTSAQSEPIASRAALRERLHATYRRFGIDPDRLPAPDAKIDIPRPPFWGGYRIYAARVELWVSGEGRLHDRAQWSRTLQPSGAGFAGASPWVATRVQP